MKAAVALEGEIRDFYSNASGLSKSLLADLPRVMLKVVRTREGRIRQLETMLEGSGCDTGTHASCG